MIAIRKSTDRGRTHLNWLNSFHTFSFGEYYDSDFMGFSTLRVINEDTVQPGTGFGTHPHRDMEIITYVVEGALEHKDSMGNGSIIRPGEIQRMSAGTGITHSEFNHSETDLVHLIQIWILPNEIGLEPSYEQKKISKKENEFILIGTKEASEKEVTIHQDVDLYAAHLTQNSVIDHIIKGKSAWLQLIRGEVDFQGQTITAGDGVQILSESMIQLRCIDDAELLFFDFS